MANKQLLEYVLRSLEAGIANEQISSALNQQGWSNEDVNEATVEAQEIINKKSSIPVVPPAPRKSEWDIDIKNLSASQVLLYLGGLIIVLAGIIYVGINWRAWGSIARILAILFPMIMLFCAGIPLWFKEQYRKQAIVFIFTGALLFPLFLSVAFNELNLFTEPLANGFGLTISLITLGLYLILGFTIRYPVWSFLCPVTGIFVYYFFLKTLGMQDYYKDKIMAWAFLLPGILYLLLGYLFEKIQKKDDSKYPYLLGVLTIVFSLSRLAVTGDLIKTFTGDLDYSINQTLIGWSMIIAGVVYLLMSLLSERLNNLNFDEAGKYEVFFNFLGSFIILEAILSMSMGGKKPFYETLLLITSLGFIFASIPKRSRQFLYIGTLFLVIYIFDIGGEYFQNQVGWPITLFVAGLMSMGIGLGIEKLRRQYFPAKT